LEGKHLLILQLLRQADGQPVQDLFAGLARQRAELVHHQVGDHHAGDQIRTQRAVMSCIQFMTATLLRSRRSAP
jgi:hypothetical protein